MDLSAPYVFEYAYRRSVGPVIGRFLGALREGRLVGLRVPSGKVHVPPCEHDPETGEDPGDDWIDVGPEGTVTTWAYEPSPRRGQPLDRPFTWALIKLDGADTALLHAVDGRVVTGARVRPRWSEERKGAITDILCFEASGSVPVPVPVPVNGSSALASRLVTPVRLDFEARAGRDLARFLAGIAEGRFIGRRCPSCRKVYVPPRGGCPTCAVPMAEEVPVSDHGTVTTFCIVNVPYEGQTMKLPYVYGSVLLDGADLPFAHLIDAPEVRMGMRVRAAWAAELKPTMESILGFCPTGEPDAPPEAWRHA